jgi:hypothetical protein
MNRYNNMNNTFEGPVDPPASVAARITIALRGFAASQDLEFEEWYHDEPRWLIWRRDGDTTRIVQIAVFKVFYPNVEQDPEDKLFCLPDMYRIAGNREFAIPPEVIRTIRLKHHIVLSKLLVENAPDQINQISSAIESAWAEASGFSESDCSFEVGTVES